MAIISRRDTHAQSLRFYPTSLVKGFARRDWLELALAVSLLGYSAWLVFLALAS